MKFSDVRVSRSFLCSIFILLFFPFVTFSCGNQEVGLTGSQMLTGATVMDEEVPPQDEIIILAFSTVVGLAISFLKNKWGRIAPIILALIGIASLFFMMNRYNDAIRESIVRVEVTFEVGFWLSMMALVGGVISNVLSLWPKENDRSNSQESIVQLDQREESITPQNSLEQERVKTE